MGIALSVMLNIIVLIELVSPSVVFLHWTPKSVRNHLAQSVVVLAWPIVLQCRRKSMEAEPKNTACSCYKAWYDLIQFSIM
jgi:hypothetical protein